MLVRAEVTLAHQLRPCVTGNFRGLGLGLLSGSPSSQLVFEPVQGVIVFCFVTVIFVLLVLGWIGCPSIGMEDMLQAAGCE